MVRAKTLWWLLPALPILLVLVSLAGFALWAGKPNPYARRPNQGTFQHWMHHYRYKLAYLVARKGAVAESACTCPSDYHYVERPMAVIDNVYEHCQQRRILDGSVMHSGTPCGFAGKLVPAESTGALIARSEWDATPAPRPATQRPSLPSEPGAIRFKPRLGTKLTTSTTATMMPF